MMSVRAEEELREGVGVVMRRFEQRSSHPRCELYYQTPFQLLVSVVLSAQTTDKGVNRCMGPLYRRGLEPEEVVAMGPEGLLQHIRSIGLAPTKSRRVVALAERIIHHHQGEIPDRYEDLVALPGVGRKTAQVVLAELYQQPVLAVDTHVFRVGKRLGWHQARDVVKAEQALMKVIPPQYLPRAHHWLILHGRYICKARRPLCEQCFLTDLCPSVQQVSRV